MAISFLTVTDTGRTLFGTAQQMSANGSLGDHWNVTGGIFETSVSITDRKIAMTETDPGSYTGGTGQLGTYTGYIIKRIHDDDDSDVVIGVGLGWFVAGIEQRIAIEGDVTGLPVTIRDYINANPTPASNMRGTDLAVLAADYVLPDNAGIANAESFASTAESQSTIAASAASAAQVTSASVDAKLTATRAANLDNCDVATSTRSSHSPADVDTQLSSTLSAIASDATDAKTASENVDTRVTAARAGYLDNLSVGAVALASDMTVTRTAAENTDTRLTATRAGYLDNLAAGPVATSAEVSAINNSTLNKLVCATEAQIPAAGSSTFTIDLLLYNSGGTMEAPDATPTITAANELGTDRSVNVSSVTNLGVGQYRADYTVSDTHAVETIILTATYIEGGQTIVAKHVMSVVAIVTGGGFTSGDRSQLVAVYDKLPSKPYLIGTNAADGDMDVGELDGDLTTLHADTSLLATAAGVAGVPAAVQSELTSSPVPSSNMRGTDLALTAAGYTAPDNAGIGNAAADAATAAAQATSAAADAATATSAAQAVDGRLTTARANNLDLLDVAISTRSTYAPLTDTVILAPGQGIATQSDLTLVKAKTDLIPASPAAVSDIPTAAQNASQVDTTLTAAHGSGAWNTLSDATLANQLSIIASIGGIVADPPSAVHVADSRRWLIEHGTEDDRAPQIITLSAGVTADLAMDFSSTLNPGTGISTVVSATDISGDTGTLVIADLLPSQDRMSAHFEVTGLEAGKRYEIKTTIATSDQQTLTGRGILRCEN